ncbi:MAG: hypothetical protein ACRC14_01230 [Paracoccaceae bacterium]
MIHSAKSLAFALALLPMAGLAETPPTVITAPDPHALQVQLAALATPQPEELRQLAVLTFIEAAQAKTLSPTELETYGETLTGLADKSGGDPEVLAIRAVYCGIEAREAGSDLDALILAQKGIKTLDALAEANPDNGGVLMQRGLAALYAPSFLGRDSVFVEDFTALLDSRFALTPAARGAVLYNLSLGYQKLGDEAAGRATVAELRALEVAPWSALGAALEF